jgi:hypothetical protein
VPARVRGHDTRAVASSLAALTGVALDPILQAGNWSSANTFLKHYFKALSPDCVLSLRGLPSLVAGRQLISTSSFPEEVATTSEHEAREEAEGGKSRPASPRRRGLTRDASTTTSSRSTTSRRSTATPRPELSARLDHPYARCRLLSEHEEAVTVAQTLERTRAWVLATSPPRS